MLRMNNHLTVLETAKILGVSGQTVRRLIQRKSLSARQSVGPHGLRWEIARAEVLRFLQAQNLEQQPQQPQQKPQQEPPQAQQPQQILVEVIKGASAKEWPSESSVEVNRQEPQQPPQAQQEAQQPQQAVPLAAHLAALQLVERLHQQLDQERQRADQAERQRLQMEWQMQQYQVALSDQAESLAEERALRMTAEAQRAQEPNQDLKLSTPARSPSWGQRLRSLFWRSETG